MTKTETKTDIAADVLAGLKGRIVKIEDREVPRMNYVLMWSDGRFVGINPDNRNDPQIVGFERATFFGDREAATIWLRRGLTDGARVAPQVVSAFNAKQHAIIVLQDVIKDLEQRMEA